MFDFGVGYSELFVLAVIAVIVIGPKDLPRILRMFGQFMNKARGMAREFQGHVDAAMKDAGVQDLKKDFQSLKSIADAPATAAAPTPYVASSTRKDFESYFGLTGSTGETRVGGMVVSDGSPTT